MIIKIKNKNKKIKIKKFSLYLLSKNQLGIVFYFEWLRHTSSYVDSQNYQIVVIK